MTTKTYKFFLSNVKNDEKEFLYFSSSTIYNKCEGKKKNSPEKWEKKVPNKKSEKNWKFFYKIKNFFFDQTRYNFLYWDLKMKVRHLMVFIKNYFHRSL